MSQIPCKHGHVDGALHRPCLKCRIEYLETERDDLREALTKIAKNPKNAADKAKLALVIAGTRYIQERVK